MNGWSESCGPSERQEIVGADGAETASDPDPDRDPSDPVKNVLVSLRHLDPGTGKSVLASLHHLDPDHGPSECPDAGPPRE